MDVHVLNLTQLQQGVSQTWGSLVSYVHFKDCLNVFHKYQSKFVEAFKNNQMDWMQDNFFEMDKNSSSGFHPVVSRQGLPWVSPQGSTLGSWVPDSSLGSWVPLSRYADVSSDIFQFLLNLRCCVLRTGHLPEISLTFMFWSHIECKISKIVWKVWKY